MEDIIDGHFMKLGYLLNFFILCGKIAVWNKYIYLSVHMHMCHFVSP